MMNLPWELWQAAIQDFWINLAFGVVILTGVGLLVLGVLFGTLMLRRAWFWLTVKSWRDVVTSAERRAFK